MSSLMHKRIRMLTPEKVKGKTGIVVGYGSAYDTYEIDVAIDDNRRFMWPCSPEEFEVIEDEQGN